MEYGLTALVIFIPWPHNLHWMNHAHTKINKQEMKKKKTNKPPNKKNKKQKTPQITFFMHLETYTTAVYATERVDKDPHLKSLYLQALLISYHCSPP